MLREEVPHPHNRMLNFTFGGITPQGTVDYKGIPMWWRHVSILLFKISTLCWMWSSGALIQVSDL